MTADTPSDNKLELVVEVDVNGANASIKSINAGLSSIEKGASSAAGAAARGFGGMTVGFMKAATAANLLAEAIKGAFGKAKEWTFCAAQYAAAISSSPPRCTPSPPTSPLWPDRWRSIRRAGSAWPSAPSPRWARPGS